MRGSESSQSGSGQRPRRGSRQVLQGTYPKSPRRVRRGGGFYIVRAGYFFWVFTALPDVLSLITTSFFFSAFLVAGSVCFGVLVVLALMREEEK